MINYRRWVSMALCAAMTLSSVTVLASDDTPASEPTAIEQEAPGSLPEEGEDASTAGEASDDALQSDEVLQLPEVTAEPEGIQLTLNGERIYLDADPVNYNGTTYVSLPDFGEIMGCTATWDAKGMVTLTRGSELKLAIQIGSDLVSANDRFFYMSDICRIINGSPMVPIRGLAKVFTLSVDWDADSQTAILSGGEVMAWAESYYNADDLLWLSRIIHAESQGEPLRGKIAVGNVVLNRVASTRFPDTIYDVVFQGNGTQFTPVRSGKIYNEPTAECVKAAKLCLEGENEIGDALYFVNYRVRANWLKNLDLVATIGCHSFYE